MKFQWAVLSNGEWVQTYDPDRCRKLGLPVMGFEVHNEDDLEYALDMLNEGEIK